MPNSLTGKDILLRKAFSLLQGRDLPSIWINHPKPYSALQAECLGLMSDSEFIVELENYLNQRNFIARSVDMFLNYMSVSERQKLDWNKPIVAMGQNLIRWVPTFLVIDGPVGRFLRWEESPIHERLGNNIPLLTDARSILDNKDFKNLRHGFAHWNFDWESSNKIHLIAYKTDKDSISTKLLLSEVDAFHIVAFSITEILDEIFFQYGRNL